MKTKFAMKEILGQKITSVRYINPHEVGEFNPLGIDLGIELENGVLVFPIHGAWHRPIMGVIASDRELTILNTGVLNQMILNGKMKVENRVRKG